MATSSTIAIKVEGGYKSIYVHNDGYFSYMYPMLFENYNTQEKAEALVNLGDASFIAKQLCPSEGSDHHFDHPEKDVSIFYHRDRGESWSHNAPNIFTKREALSWQWYAYIFEDGCWHAYEGGKEISDYSY